MVGSGSWALLRCLLVFVEVVEGAVAPRAVVVSPFWLRLDVWGVIGLYASHYGPNEQHLLPPRNGSV